MTGLLNYQVDMSIEGNRIEMRGKGNKSREELRIMNRMDNLSEYLDVLIPRSDMSATTDYNPSTYMITKQASLDCRTTIVELYHGITY